ncbi:hypothetical protein ON010_g9920 [Phytophthora cinnamomi]|nr:hypothetical protein ON010_g9920 [Phytophthora cinnamomi]
MRLHSGERMEWWSTRKYDRRDRMRALVMGAVNDKRTQILLDTGPNVSAVTEAFAWTLRLKRITSNDTQINVQSVNKGKPSTTARAMVKMTLGWQLVYEFEIWITPHYTGVDVILGTAFMIPAGVRLNLFNSTAKLPNEVAIPLQSPSWMSHPMRAEQPSSNTHELWVPRAKDWIATVVHGSRNKPTKVLMTNVSEKLVWFPAHFSVIIWMPRGELPPDDGYARLNSAKYRDWQVLAYEAAMDQDLLKKEQSLYNEWLTKQPLAVEKKAYPPPSGVMKRSPRRLRDGGAELTCSQRHELLEQSVPAVVGFTCAGGLTVESAEPTKSAASGADSIGRVHEAGEVVAEIQQAHDTTTQLNAEFKDNDNSAGAITGNPPADRTEVTSKPLTGNTESRCAHIPRNFEGFVLSFDGSAKTMAKGGYGSCSWIVWRLPAWDIEIAASAYLSSTTGNIAEYIGMNNGVMAALSRGVANLIIVADSRLLIQQTMGALACKEEESQIELVRRKNLTKKLSSVRYVHVVRYYNAAADSLASEALETMAGRSNSGESNPHGSADRVSAKPKNQTRRVHFGDGYQEGSRENFMKSEQTKSMSAEYETLSTLPSFIPQSSNKYSNRESKNAPAQIHRAEVQVEAEVDDNCFPDSAGTASATTQAERRRGTAEFAAEMLKCVNSKVRPEDELNDLSPRRVADAQREFPLKEGPIAEKTQRAEKPEARLGRMKCEAQRDSTDTATPIKCPPAESTRYLFKEGSHVWLTMKLIKPRVKTKLVRHWRRPFGVKKSVDEHYKKRETRLQLVQVADES